MTMTTTQTTKTIPIVFRSPPPPQVITTMMNRGAASRLLWLAVLVAAAARCCSAFVVATRKSSNNNAVQSKFRKLQQRERSHAPLHLGSPGHFGDEEGPAVTAAAAPQRRRLFLQAAVAAALVTVGTFTSVVEPAGATYSAYSHREDDWQQRQKDGAVQFSSAASLRSQLREIAPMNASERRLFCPNGTPSAVSPLMENKCGDRLAMPSVYGRTEDTMGNSIPGFAGGFYSSGMTSSAISSSSSMADTGGLPSYSKYTGK
jgi:hypothetical protein